MKRLLTDTEVAEFFGIHRATVWKWAKDGRLPAPIYPLGARIARWRREDIEQAIAA
ncbi:MAG: helix-turn-helix transcriptional regulator [Hasllibacter sp.]